MKKKTLKKCSLLALATVAVAVTVVLLVGQTLQPRLPWFLAWVAASGSRGWNSVFDSMVEDGMTVEELESYFGEPVLILPKTASSKTHPKVDPNWEEMRCYPNPHLNGFNGRLVFCGEGRVLDSPRP